MRDLERLASQLRPVLKGGDRLTGIRHFANGFSNETYFIDGLDQISRVPQGGPSLLEARSVLEQAKIYRQIEAFDGTPPVPHVVYLNEDGSIIGEPFFVMDRLPGISFNEQEIPDWLSGPPDQFRDELSRSYITAVSSVHKVPPLDLLGKPASPLEELDRWRRFAMISGHEELVELTNRLQARPALPSSGPPTVVHGDPKPGNTMWTGNQISGLLDWEMSFNGEPLADVGYMLYFFPSHWHDAQLGMDLPGIWDRAKVISYWEKTTGRSATGVEWFEAAAFCKLSAITAHAIYLYRSGQSGDERAEWLVPFTEASIAALHRFFEHYPA